MPRTLRDTEGGDQDSVPTSNSATRLPCADSRGGWDYCSPDETLRRGEEAAQALVVPCSGLHAHRPARSHSSAQPRPPVHRTRRRPHRGARVTAVTGTRGRHATQGHTHAGRQGAVGVHGGLQDAQRGVPRKRKRWRSQTQTGVSWHHDFRHTTPQRTSEPSVTGLLDTQPLSNDTLPQT